MTIHEQIWMGRSYSPKVLEVSGHFIICIVESTWKL